MKDVAYIVSCSDYEDSTIGNLNYADADAENIKDIFEKELGINDVRSLTSAEKGGVPTRSRVIRELKRGRNEEPIRVLFFYYSGHGFRSGMNGKDYIALADTVAGDLEDTALSLEKICGLLREFHAMQVVLWIDACKTVADSGHKGGFGFNMKAEYLNGLAIFYSCSEGEASFESDKIQMSLFTYSLCRAFQTHSCRTIGELNRYLVKEVPENCIELGKRPQHPFIQIKPLEAENVYLIKDPESWFHEVRKPVKYQGGCILKDGVLSIDFGTSYTVAAVSYNNQLYYSKDKNKKIFVPTVISIDRDFGYYVGVPPEGKDVVTIRGIKRLIGIKDSFEINGLNVKIEFLISLILKSVIQNAEEYLKMEFRGVCLAKPTTLTRREELILRESLRLAGKELVRLFTESDCVILTEDEEEEGAVLAIDFGGGTCDISGAELGDGIVEILFTMGDARLGGIDFDHSIEEYLAKEIKTMEPPIIMDEGVIRQIQKEAELVKISLGNAEESRAVIHYAENLEGELVDIEIPITRNQFMEICREPVSRFRELLQKARGAVSECLWQPLGQILLTGQNSQCFFVREFVEEYFPRAECRTQSFSSAVVQGMSSYSTKLAYGALTRNVLLLPVSTYSIEIPYWKEQEEEWIAHETDDKTDEESKVSGALVISSRKEENTSLCTLVDANTTIPTKKSVEISGESGSSLFLVIFAEDGRREEIAVELEGEMILEVDIGTNREINIQLYDSDYNLKRRISL